MPDIDQARIDAATRGVERGVAHIASTLSREVDTALYETGRDLDTLAAVTTLRTAAAKIATVKASLAIYMAGSLKITHIFYHRSPQIFAILLSIYTFVSTVTRIMNFIRTVSTVIYWFTTISDILASVWPQYQQFITRVWQKVSEVSGLIGWGVDGFLHVMNTIQAGQNVWGALRGYSGSELMVERGQRSVDIATSLSDFLDGLQRDPGAALKRIVENRRILDGHEMRTKWGEIMSNINAGLFRGETALRHVQTIAGEFYALRADMPEIIAQHIPQGIWTALDDANDFINDTIMPNLNRIQGLVESFESVLHTNQQVLSELAGKIAYPGSMLQDVDDLPYFLRRDEQARVDDVASREFEIWSAIEREDIAADLDDFDRIDNALKAPTPEPGYFALEAAGDKGLHGITVTPQETWFIDGYSDQH